MNKISFCCRFSCHPTRIALARYYSSYSRHSPRLSRLRWLDSGGAHQKQPEEADLINAFRTSPEWKQQREDIRNVLEEVVQSLDANYRVRSVGMDQYGIDIQNGSPFDFAIEKKEPAGDQTNAIPSSTSPLNNTTVVASALRKKWPEITIENQPVEKNSKEIWPASLRIHDALAPAVISLPNPHTPRRTRILQRLFRAERHKELLALVSLWTRSLGWNTITPMALAFLTGGIMLENGRYKGRLLDPAQTRLRAHFDKFLESAAILQAHKPPMYMLKAEPPFYKYPSASQARLYEERWSHTGFAIQDPFIPTKNLVDNITTGDWTRLTSLAKIAHGGATIGKPITSLFGHQLNFDHLKEMSEPTSMFYDAWGQYMKRFEPAPENRTKMPQLKTFEEKPKPPADQDEAFLQDLLKIPAEFIEKRQKTLDNVNRAVRTKYPWTTVHPFGSVCYGTPKSQDGDFPMMIYDPHLEHGHTIRFIGPKFPLYRLPNLAMLLKQEGFWHVKMQGSPTTPKVYFTDPETGVDCEININDRLRFYSTKLIQQYCELFPPLREMIKFIKTWAGPLGLNNPSHMSGEPITFGNYEIALLTIGFLQRHLYLPNFQTGLKPIPLLSKSLATVRTAVGEEPTGTFWSKKPLQLCDIRWKDKPLRNRAPIPPTRELIKGWFKFYGQEFDYDGDIIEFRPVEAGVPRMGDFNMAAKRAMMPNVMLSDMFNTNKNAAKHIGSKALKHFVKECNQALEKLEVGESLASLIAPPGDNPLRDPTKGTKESRRKNAEKRQRIGEARNASKKLLAEQRKQQRKEDEARLKAERRAQHEANVAAKKRRLAMEAPEPQVQTPIDGIDGLSGSAQF